MIILMFLLILSVIMPTMMAVMMPTTMAVIPSMLTQCSERV